MKSKKLFTEILGKDNHGDTWYILIDETHFKSENNVSFYVFPEENLNKDVRWKALHIMRAFLAIIPPYECVMLDFAHNVYDTSYKTDYVTHIRRPPSILAELFDDDYSAQHNFENRGIGTLLLQRIESWAFSNGIKLIKGSLSRSGLFYSIFGPLAISDNSALIAAQTGLWILDISDIQNPSEIFFFTTGESVRDIEVVDDTAYVANGHAGFLIIDVTNPVAPQKVGHLHSKGFLSSLSLVGDFAFLLNYLSSLWIADVSDPTFPVELGRLAIDGNSLAASDSLAYITIPDSGLAVVDVQDPINPKRIGFCSLLGGVEDVEIAGNYAYVGTSIDGLHIIDISDPRSPIDINRFRDGPVSPLIIGGDYVYAAHNGRMYIIDISVPSQAWVAGSTEAIFYQYPQDITIAENYVTLTVGFPSIKTIDVSTSNEPKIVGYYGNWWGGYCIEASEEYLYWGHGPGGFFILRNDLMTAIAEPANNNIPNSFVMLQNYPNPFNAQTCLEYHIPYTTEVFLAVYNVLGQVVIVLENDLPSAGHYNVIWNGRNKDGLDVASGIYFARLRAGDLTTTKKMVLIR